MIVWLASYPRSGNTFFRVLLNSIFNIKTYSIYDDRFDIGADKKTADIVGHIFLPKNFDLAKARVESEVYYIKTHDLPDEKVTTEDKVIYLVRDGRDAIVSFKHYFKDYFDLEADYKDLMLGNYTYGAWGSHVKQWLEHQSEQQLLIKFEQLTRQPEQLISVLAAFLQVSPLQKQVPAFADLKKINNMFFRQGTIASWQNDLSKEEHDYFWQLNANIMDKLGYQK